MTPPEFAFCLTCLCLGTMAQKTDPTSSSFVHKESGVISANVGDEVTLQCFYKGDMTVKFYWYKQTLGQKPRLISTAYKFDAQPTFHAEFQDNTRFTLDFKAGHNHLRITDLHVSDTATYFCACSYSYIFEFMEGINLSVTGSGKIFQFSVNQSESGTIQHGGAATLSCPVDTWSCDEDHRVYWFKNSKESHPGIIYTQGGRQNQCQRKPDQNRCEFNMPVSNLDQSGTYHCAVMLCGHVLFGNGTKLNLKDKGYTPYLVYFLSGALAFMAILTVLLAVFIYVAVKRDSKCEESARISAPSTTNEQGDHNEENIHYAALRKQKVKSSRRQQNVTTTECVYSSVKQ